MMAPGPALAEEVRALLAAPAAAPAWSGVRAAVRTGDADPRPLYRLLGRYGLLAPSWPVRYGGRGMPAWSMAVVVREMIAAGVPDTLHTLSVQICGTFLRDAGTPAQRAGWLPALAAGQRFASVLYTEPTVGSDLASLTTTAEPDRQGGWVITGRKVYSVRTELADIGLVAARTARGAATPYQGITLFLVPLDAPGVAVGSLPSMADEDFADVRLDGVRVPASCVVGPVGSAWPLITEALALERTGVDQVAKADAWLRAWRRAARTAAGDGAAPTGDGPTVGGAAPGAAAGPGASGGEDAGAGALWVRVEAGRALSDRCVERLDAGRVDPVRAAATKLWCSETAADVAWWCAGDLHDRAGTADRLAAAYREAPGLTISAGTSEMMLELVAAGLSDVDDTVRDGEPLLGEVRRAVRWAVGGPPAGHHPQLGTLGLLGCEVPARAGGLGLPAPAGLAVVAELGAVAVDGGLLDTMTGIDALAAAVGDDRGEGAARWGADLGAVLAGRRRVALAHPDRPHRPATDPGPDGLVLLVLRGPDRLALLPRDHPAVTARPAPTVAAADHVTVEVAADGLVEAQPLCDGTAAREVLAADARRRAGWLLGAGGACLAATVRRARSRSQFGRSVLDNQSVAYRLARLAVTGQALHALLDCEAGSSGSALAAGALGATGEFALAATRVAIQLHGAYGMLAGSPVERHYRQVPVLVATGPPTAALYRFAASHALNGDRS